MGQELPSWWLAWLGCVGSHSPTPIPAKDNGVVFLCNYIHVLHTSDATISGWWWGLYSIVQGIGKVYMLSMDGHLY